MSRLAHRATSALGIAGLAIVAMASAVSHAADKGADFGSRVLKAKPAVITGMVGLSEADKARATLYAFAGCIVSRTPGRIDRYAAMKADQDHTWRYLDDLATQSGCLSNGMLEIPQIQMRGAIFRYLYTRDFAADPASPAAEPVDFRPYASGENDYVRRMAFGDCVARADFSAAARFVRSRVGSGEETAALNQIKPKLAECLANGASLTLNKAALAAMLSEAVYREARASVVTDSSRTTQ